MIKKTVFWFIGTQRSGKTMLSETLSKLGAMTLNIGEHIRKMMDVEELKNTENPYAPKVTEELALELIQGKIIDFRFSDYNTLIIDSAPRSGDQLAVLLKHNDLKHIVVFVDDDFEKRKQRALEKYQNLDYFLSRENKEQEWVRNLLQSCLDLQIPYVVINGRIGTQWI